jgi:hypothetical protein
LSKLNTTRNWKESIKNGFRLCGLYPWNVDNVDYSKCIGKKKTIESDETVGFEQPINGPTEANDQEHVDNAEIPIEEIEIVKVSQNILCIDDFEATIRPNLLQRIKTATINRDNEAELALYNLYAKLCGTGNFQTKI